MTDLYRYLGIGIAAVAVAYDAHRLKKEKESEPLRDLLEAVNADRNELSCSPDLETACTRSKCRKSGRIAVKVINHLGDEVIKVFKV